LTDASAAKFDPSDAAYDANTAVSVSSVDTKAGEIMFQFGTTAGLTNETTTGTTTVTADGGRKANVVTSAVTTYDSLGNAHNITLTFTKLGTNTWTWTASVPGTSTASGDEVTSNGTLTFNSDGSLDASGISPNDPSLSFTPVSGAEVVDINLDFGEGFNGITQTSESSVVSSLEQDGSPAASLKDITISKKGDIIGVFSNGNSQILAQLMIAKFSNYNGLVSAGNNFYSEYANSGEAVITTLGDASGTTVESGYLEESNVDLSEEFTDLIIAQRGFQACSRIITTSDRLLEEITNLVR
jgi:flagellar hook protein FlgE